MGSNRQVKKQGRSSVVARHRSWCKQLSGEWFLDPGNPAVKDYLRALVGEVVSKYDVDGIHLDYVRYPDNAMRFPIPIRLGSGEVEASLCFVGEKTI